MNICEYKLKNDEALIQKKPQNTILVSTIG